MSWAENVLSRAAGWGIIFGLLNFQNLATAQNWQSLTPLPDGYEWQSLAYSSNFLYQAGGSSYANGSSDGVNVFYAQVQTNGTIGAWKYATPLPDAIFLHAGVAANGFVYVLGGYHFIDGYGLMISNAVYYSKINSDGSLGAWQSANPMPVPLFYLSASVWNNTIYIAGGTDGNVYYSNVYSAKIQTDGSLSAWSAQPSLPNAIYIQAEAANGFLYVLGGIIDDGSDVINTVNYSKINTDGSLAGWNQTTPMSQPLSANGVIAAGGRLFTIAGSNGSQITGEFASSPVAGDGTLGAWSAGVSLPQSLYSFGFAVSGSYIFVTGGSNPNGNPVATVYSIALPAPPAAPTLTKSNLVNGTFNLRLTSTQTNLGFGLLASTNLVNWTNIGWGFTDTNGFLNFQDTNAASVPNRFYRAYWPLP